MTNEEQLMLEEKWIDSLKENTKLKAEIEQLKENYDTLARQYSNVENSSIKYYNKLKQLKSTISKMETTTAQEDDLK